jgi:PAS domain S-box-containing protein
MKREEKTGVFIKLDSNLIVRGISQTFTEQFGITEKSVIRQGLSSFVEYESDQYEGSQLPKVIEAKIVNKKLKRSYSCILVPSFEDQEYSMNYRVCFDSPLSTPGSEQINEAAFEAMFDHVAIGVVTVSMKGRILKANDSFQSHIEYSEAELQQMTFAEFTHTEDVDKDLEYNSQLINDEIQNYQLEKRWVTKRGKTIWVHISVSLVRDNARKILYAVVVVQNVNTVKKQQLALKKYQVRLEKTFVGAKGAVFHWPDVEKDKIWWSPNFQGILGYTKKKFVSKISKFFDIIHPKDMFIVEEGLKNLFEKNKAYNLDYRLKVKNGNYKLFNTIGRVERDKNGLPTQMMGFVSDIDHLKKAQNLLSIRNLALEKSKQELENFAHIASHDLQEPLRTIISFIQLIRLSLDVDLSEESRMYLETVEKASKRMHKLTEDLLNYCKIDLKESEMEFIDTQRLVCTVVSDIIVRTQEADAHVHFKNLLPVSAESSKLYRLFNNLIVNAIKFKSHGTPSIIKVESKAEGKRVRFNVIDNGIGIAEEHHEDVFKIFRRLHTREDYEGSGIGLSVSRKIVELFNGRISISANHDGGSCVSFDLPKPHKS